MSEPEPGSELKPLNQEEFELWKQSVDDLVAYFQERVKVFIMNRLLDAMEELSEGLVAVNSVPIGARTFRLPSGQRCLVVTTQAAKAELEALFPAQEEEPEPTK